jgi:chemotaxis protein methyltransferase CheR
MHQASAALGLDPAGFDLNLTAEDLAFVAEVAYREAGIVIRPHKQAMARGRLARRARSLGVHSIADYCDLLRGPQAKSEIPFLINALTTNHTSFFRERHHFDHLRTEVLPPLLDSGARRIRIWSSASSTGEEPYCIAAIVNHAVPNRPGLDLKILATDLDTDVLARAEAGRYPQDSLQRMPADLGPLLRAETGAGELRMPQQLKRWLTFRQLNLIEPWPFSGQFDVIFCRNVLIYFDAPTKADVVDRMTEVLKPGGWLYLGHSESLSQPHPALELAGRTTYRRRG